MFVATRMEDTFFLTSLVEEVKKYRVHDVGREDSQTVQFGYNEMHVPYSAWSQIIITVIYILMESAGWQPILMLPMTSFLQQGEKQAVNRCMVTKTLGTNGRAFEHRPRTRRRTYQDLMWWDRLMGCIHKWEKIVRKFERNISEGFIDWKRWQLLSLEETWKLTVP